MSVGLRPLARLKHCNKIKICRLDIPVSVIIRKTFIITYLMHKFIFYLIYLDPLKERNESGQLGRD